MEKRAGPTAVHVRRVGDRAGGERRLTGGEGGRAAGSGKGAAPLRSRAKEALATGTAGTAGTTGQAHCARGGRARRRGYVRGVAGAP